MLLGLASEGKKILEEGFIPLYRNPGAFTMAPFNFHLDLVGPEDYPYFNFPVDLAHIVNL